MFYVQQGDHHRTLSGMVQTDDAYTTWSSSFMPNGFNVQVTAMTQIALDSLKTAYVVDVSEIRCSASLIVRQCSDSL